MSVGLTVGVMKGRALSASVHRHFLWQSIAAAPAGVWKSALAAPVQPSQAVLRRTMPLHTIMALFVMMSSLIIKSAGHQHSMVRFFRSPSLVVIVALPL